MRHRYTISGQLFYLTVRIRSQNFYIFSLYPVAGYQSASFSRIYHIHIFRERFNVLLLVIRSVKSEEATMMKPLVHLHVDLHDVLTRVGVFGPWQLRTVIMLMIASFIGGK